MTEVWSPQRWANTLTKLLDTIYGTGSDRFPVNVRELARDYSHQRFPEDPITLIAGEQLAGFDGGLYRAPAGKQGWGIIYNNAMASAGRINFTLGHEFGHYLAHRHAFPNGLRCGQQDMVRWDSDYSKTEREANLFAALLLMPLHDFRRQIGAATQPSLDDLGACASRYGVSLIATVLQWLTYTTSRSVLVVSREGFILWARSSESALKTRAFFRTAMRPPIPVHQNSLAGMLQVVAQGTVTVSHPAGVWLDEPCTEHILHSDRYDFAVSLLHYGAAPPWRPESDEEFEPDVLDVMQRLNSRR